MRKIVHRCVKQAHRVLKAPPDVVGSLVPIVVESMVSICVLVVLKITSVDKMLHIIVNM